MARLGSSRVFGDIIVDNNVYSLSLNTSQLIDINGNELIKFPTVISSAVNELTVTNSATGNPVIISTSGDNTDIGLNITTKGNGNIIIDTGTGTGDIELKPGSSNLRLYDDDSTHYYQFVTGNRSANYNITFPAASTTIPVMSQVLTFDGPSAARTYTLPNSNQTLAGLGLAQTFLESQIISKSGGSDGDIPFTTPHLKLAANTTLPDNKGYVGITYATSTADNYGYSLGALRTSDGQGNFMLKFHNNSAVGTEIFKIGTTGVISAATWQGGVISSTYGGTGVNNAGRTLTINTNSGTLSFTNSSTTLTIANTGSISGTNTGDQTNITGNAGSATLIATTQKGEAVNYQIPFVASVSPGNQALYTDSISSLTFNPSTDTLTVPNLSVTGNTFVSNVEMISTSNGIVFEGTTNDDFETTLKAVNPTADQTYQLPNKAAGTYTLIDSTWAGSSTSLNTLASSTSLGSGTQTWQIETSGSDLLFRSGATPSTQATLSTSSLSLVGDMNIASGKKYKINGTDLSAADVGAATSGHTHSYLPLSGGTLTNDLTVNTNILMPVKGTAGTNKIHISLQGVAANDVANENGGAFIEFRTSTSANYGAYIGGHRKTGGGSSLIFITGTTINPTTSMTLNENKDLDVLGNMNIASGKKYKINGTDLSAADVGAMVNPMTTAGDIIYGGTAGVPTRLGAGDANRALLSGGTGAPTWTTGTLTLNKNLTVNNTYNIALEAAGADRTLKISNANKEIAGAATVLTFGGNFTHTGAHTLGITTSAATSVTLPTAGTLATLTGTETLSGKTLTLPKINDTSSDHTYTFAVSELAENRTITLPLLTANDTFVFASFTQTLSSKTLTSPTINAGTADSLTSLSVRDTSAAFNVTIAGTSSTVLTAGRKLTLDLVNADRTLKLTGSPSLSGITTSGTGTLALTENATFTKALTVNTGTITLTGNSANTSVLVLPAGSLTLPASVAGGILYGSSTTAYAVSAAGTANQALLSGGTGAPTWTTGALSLSKNLTVSNNFNMTLTASGADRTLSISGANKEIAGAATVLTFGGNFTHTGAHTLGITTTAATSVTLPTSGTLINSAWTGSSTLNTLSSSTSLTSGSGTQTWQIETSGSDLLFRSGATPTTRMTLKPGTGLLFADANGGGTAIPLALGEATGINRIKTYSGSYSFGFLNAGDGWAVLSAGGLLIDGTHAVYHANNAPTAALTTATKSEMEVGTSTTVRGMTPQRVKESVLSAPAAVEKTDDYAFTLPDAGLVFLMNNGSSKTFTISENTVSNSDFPVGTEIHMVRYGAGDTVIAPGTNVTILSEDSKRKINNRYQVVTIKKLATNTWLLFGALKA